MTLRLYITHYSPWSELARWSLDVQGIPYEPVPIMPVVGSAGLRVRARRLRGALRAPIAVKDGQVFRDSFAIASFGASRSLCPVVLPADRPAIERWAERSERMLQAGRLLTVARVRSDDAAVREYLPRPAARLRRVGSALGRRGASWLLRHGDKALDHRDARDILRDDLARLRAALNASSTDFLVADRLTYADLAAACALQFVEPVSDRWFRLGPASRPLWRDPELAAEFADLVVWRDALYAEYRDRRANSAALVVSAPVVGEATSAQAR